MKTYRTRDNVALCHASDEPLHIWPYVRPVVIGIAAYLMAYVLTVGVML